MPRNITSTLTAFALATAVNVFAQEQAPAQPQPEKQQAAKETLTGCVVQAKTTDGGNVFILSNAEGGSAKVYVLGGSAQTDWQTNVSKKVEVTGPVLQPPPPPAEDGAAGKPGVLRPPMMEVESMKVVAETCK
jgi:hypothetical protein